MQVSARKSQVLALRGKLVPKWSSLYLQQVGRVKRPEVAALDEMVKVVRKLKPDVVVAESVTRGEANKLVDAALKARRAQLMIVEI